MVVPARHINALDVTNLLLLYVDADSVTVFSGNHLSLTIRRNATKSSGFLLPLSIRRWMYYKSYFPSLGLRIDDCLHEYPDVKEALRRLPKDQLYEREFRISRALQLSLQKNTLPREEWTKFEEDVRYLKPYLDDVRAEQREKKWWAKLN